MRVSATVVTLLLMLLLARVAPADVQLPAERRSVYDLSGFLTPDGLRAVEERLHRIEADNGPRIVVLALKQPSYTRGWEVSLEAEAVRRWGLDEDKQRTTFLYVYCGWSFQHLVAYGRPISQEMDDSLSAPLDIARVVVERNRSHDRALLAAVDAIPAVLAGRTVSVPTPLPFEPNASGWVVDEAGVLGDAAKTRLNGILAAHEKATSNQVVVVTVPSLKGDTIEAVALARATEMKLGQKGKDNGVLLFVAPNDRKVRIEVGYGLEAVLPDARASRIIREEILPRFKASDIDGGVEAGVGAILGTITGTYAPSAATRSRRLVDVVRFLPAAPVAVQVVVGFIVGVVLLLVGSAAMVTAVGPVRWLRGALFAGLPGLLLCINYPAALFPIALLAFVLLRKETPGGASESTGSAEGLDLSSSGPISATGFSSSNDDRSPTFSGGGGAFGGGGASGSW